MGGSKNPSQRATGLETQTATKGDAAPDRTPKLAVPNWSRRRDQTLFGRIFRASTTEAVSLAAADYACFATLALFPAISVLISVCGMILDPVAAAQQFAALSASCRRRHSP